MMTGTKSNGMCLIYFLLLTTVKAMETETPIWENVHNNNGWTPINRDKVYNSLPKMLFSGTNNKETLNQNINEITHAQSFAEEVTPKAFFQPRYINFKDDVAPSPISLSFSTDSKAEKLEEYLFKIDSIQNRKAKAILNNEMNAGNMLIKPEKIITQRDVDNATVKHEYQYQVTENQEQNEGLENIYSNVIKPLVDEPSNNHYDIVNGTVQDNAESNANEFTNKFLSILSSYNIRVNDALPNYELSRHLNKKPSIREYIMVPIPIKLLNRFNNLNPIPFDPLLAVFLSNFGYYLPGHYGINNKYNNLYGYLASNNIHNNEPFGSYKIFADTDSSN